MLPNKRPRTGPTPAGPRSSLVCLSGVLISIFFAGASFAQTPPRSTSVEQGTGDSLAEVVVVAQRRSEDAQKVPISVAAVSADQAKNAGVVDLQSLADVVPGLVFATNGNNPTPFIRGVGTGIGQAGDEPSVAFYVDDVYMPTNVASSAQWANIDKIEVEKGPQGTLFGRNATGGVIQVFTRDPTDTPTAELTAGYGNYNTKTGSLYASVPISSTLAANLSLYGSDESSGWGRNVTTGNPTYLAHGYGGRMKALWSPDDSTRIKLTLSYDYTYSQVGAETRNYPGTAGGVGGVPGLRTDFLDNNIYDTDGTLDPYFRVAQAVGSIKIDHRFDWANLVSVSSYQKTHTEVIGASQNDTIPLLNFEEVPPETAYSQELRFLSPDSAPFTWIFGGFFFHDSTGYEPLWFTPSIFSPNVLANYAIQDTRSFSGFGQTTFNVLTDTHLTLGARYTSDHRSLEGYFTTQGVTGIDPGSPTSHTWNKPTWRLSLDHQFSPDVMAYIAYNRGFKSGVYNTVVTGGAALAPPVAPEVLDAYTIGAKTEWLAHKLRVNVEGFWYNYKDIQIQQNSSTLTVLSNAAGARIKGIDLDAMFKVTRQLSLSAAVEFMDGYYTSFPGGVYNTYDPVNGGNIQSSANLAGYQTIDTPPFSATLTGNFTQPLDEYGTLDLNLTYSHTGNFYHLPDNGAGQPTRDADRQPIINLVDAALNWHSANERYEVTLWGKNIANQKYYSYMSYTTFATAISAAPPATYGARFTVYFDK